MDMDMARGPLMLKLDMEVMVDMAVDMEDIVVVMDMDTMARGLLMLKLDTMEVMVDIAVDMEDIVVVMDMDMARGPLMLKLDMEVMVDMAVDMEDMEDTVDIVEDVMDNLYLFSMFHLSLI